MTIHIKRPYICSDEPDVPSLVDLDQSQHVLAGDTGIEPVTSSAPLCVKWILLSGWGRRRTMRASRTQPLQRPQPVSRAQPPGALAERSGAHSRSKRRCLRAVSARLETVQKVLETVQKVLADTEKRCSLPWCCMNRGKVVDTPPESTSNS